MVSTLAFVVLNGPHRTNRDSAGVHGAETAHLPLFSRLWYVFSDGIFWKIPSNAVMQGCSCLEL